MLDAADVALPAVILMAIEFDTHLPPFVIWLSALPQLFVRVRL
jgi:hypothetical protein